MKQGILTSIIFSLSILTTNCTDRGIDIYDPQHVAINYPSENTQWLEQTDYPYNLKIGVILVDFTPNKRYKGPNFQDGYPKSMYENFYFSGNTWKSNETASPHPDGHPLFGSVHDYYYDQSNGNISIVGKYGQSLIINEADSEKPLLPKWLELPNPMEYYQENFKERYYLAGHFFNKAIEEYGEDLINTFDGLVFIFAGKERTSGNLRSGYTHPTGPQGFPLTKVKGVIVIGEQSIHPMYNGFNHIGGHVHELGHLLGMSDEYQGKISPGVWEVMANGESNNSGGQCIGNCPAPFSPIHKLYMNWQQPIIINELSGEVEIKRDIERPFIYKIEIPNSDEYFAIEKRDGSGFEAFTPDKTIGQGPWDGVLIWHGKPSEIYDKVELERSTLSDYIFPENDHHNYFESIDTLGITSSPSSTMLRDGITYSGINIIIRNDFDLATKRVRTYVRIDDPSPEKPNNISGTFINNCPQITFDNNNELDFKHFRIFKKINGVFSKYAKTTHSYFTDHSETKYKPGNQKEYVEYKLVSVDHLNQQSEETKPVRFAVNARETKKNIFVTE